MWQIILKQEIQICLRKKLFPYLRIYAGLLTGKEIMSKYEACRYLNVGRSTFDSYVRSGELPRGVRKPGFKNILFLKKDLDLFIKKKREKHNKKDSSICL